MILRTRLGDVTQADLVDYAIRGLVSAAAADPGPVVVEYLEAYSIPAAAAVAERHDLRWIDAGAAGRWRRRIARATGVFACAARAFARAWGPTLERPGLLVPIRDGGRYVSAKVFRPPDAAGRRGKYILRGLCGRYLWGADEVDDAVEMVYIVEGEGDKMALDGLFEGDPRRPSTAVVATGGTGVAGDEERLARIAAWCDPLLQSARVHDGLPPRRVIVLADPDAAGRRAAASIAAATGAEVADPGADARDLVARGVFRPVENLSKDFVR